MRILFTFFFTAIILFLTVSLRSYFQIDLPAWAIFYLNDFLCMPIVLTICLLTVQLIKNDPSIRLSLFSILSLTTFYAVWFEIFFPRIEDRYTGDIWDVVMYFSGSMVFYFLQYQK